MANNRGNGGRGQTNNTLWSEQKSPPLPRLCSDPVVEQVKSLHSHYLLNSRQIPTIRCKIDVAMPTARVVCPQIKYRSLAVSQGQVDMVYGPDVPYHVIQQGKVMVAALEFSVVIAMQEINSQCL